MTTLKKSDFYFDLPQELIAQDPLEDRSSSRLLVLNRETGEVEHRHFKEITDYLKQGDCLVLNNTKVIPARLMGVKEDTGAAIEVLLLKRRDNDVWETLVKPGKKARPGAKIVFGDGCLRAEVLDVVEEGNRLIRFDYEGIFEEVLDRLGEMPLPPYITHKLQDKNRYQTVYAKYEGSAAVRRTLHRAAACRPHADHAPAALLRAVDQLRHLGRHLIMLGMHVVLQNVVRFHGTEGAQPHMKGHICNFHPHFLYLRK